MSNLCLAYSIAPGIVVIASFVGVFVVKGMQQFLQPMLQGLQLWLVWILEPNLASLGTAFEVSFIS
jgi:hypothetical protein